MQNRRRWLAALLVLTGLALAIRGQYFLCYYRDTLQAGLSYYVAALVMLALGTVLSIEEISFPSSLLDRFARAAPAEPWRPLALAASFGLVVLAAYLAHWHESWYSVPVWLLGIVIGTAALWRAGQKLKFNRSEVVSVSLIVGLAFVLRISWLASFPNPMSFHPQNQSSIQDFHHRVMRGVLVTDISCPGSGVESQQHLD